MDVSIIDEGKEYIWWSERTGWGQFYRYNSDGELKNEITKGNFVAGNIVKIDTAAQTMYFTAFGKETVSTHIINTYIAYVLMEAGYNI